MSKQGIWRSYWTQRPQKGPFGKRAENETDICAEAFFVDDVMQGLLKTWHKDGRLWGLSFNIDETNEGECVEFNRGLLKTWREDGFLGWSSFSVNEKNEGECIEYEYK